MLRVRCWSYFRQVVESDVLGLTLGRMLRVRCWTYFRQDVKSEVLVLL